MMLAGLASLSFMRGTRLCPPAKIFESFSFFSKNTASVTVVGEYSSKRRGIILVLTTCQKVDMSFRVTLNASGFLGDDPVPERPPNPLGGDLDDVADLQEPLGPEVPFLVPLARVEGGPGARPRRYHVPRIQDDVGGEVLDPFAEPPDHVPGV